MKKADLPVEILDESFIVPLNHIIQTPLMNTIETNKVFDVNFLGFEGKLNDINEQISSKRFVSCFRSPIKTLLNCRKR